MFPNTTFAFGEIPSTGSSNSGGGSTWQTIFNGGVGLTQSILGYKLASKQIDKGQNPSVGYDPKTGNPAFQNLQLPGSGSIGGISIWLILGVLALVLFIGRK